MAYRRYFVFNTSRFLNNIIKLVSPLIQIIIMYIQVIAIVFSLFVAAVSLPYIWNLFSEYIRADCTSWIICVIHKAWMLIFFVVNIVCGILILVVLISTSSYLLNYISRIIISHSNAE